MTSEAAKIVVTGSMHMDPRVVEAPQFKCEVKFVRGRGHWCHLYGCVRQITTGT